MQCRDLFIFVNQKYKVCTMRSFPCLQQDLFIKNKEETVRIRAYPYVVFLILPHIGRGLFSGASSVYIIVIN